MSLFIGALARRCIKTASSGIAAVKIAHVNRTASRQRALELEQKANELVSLLNENFDLDYKITHGSKNEFCKYVIDDGSGAKNRRLIPNGPEGAIIIALETQLQKRAVLAISPDGSVNYFNELLFSSKADNNIDSVLESHQAENARLRLQSRAA